MHLSLCTVISDLNETIYAKHSVGHMVDERAYDKGIPDRIYTTIGGLSSTFEEFLSARSQFNSDHGVEILRLNVANPRPLCDRFLRFIVRCFVRIFFIVMRHYISCRA